MRSIQTLDRVWSPIKRQRSWLGNQTIEIDNSVIVITEIVGSAGGQQITYLSLDGELVNRTTDPGRVILFFPIYTFRVTLPPDVVEVQGFEVVA